MKIYGFGVFYSDSVDETMTCYKTRNICSCEANNTRVIVSKISILPLQTPAVDGGNDVVIFEVSTDGNLALTLSAINTFSTSSTFVSPYH